jgi:hypothetical protein
MPNIAAASSTAHVLRIAMLLPIPLSASNYLTHGD